jgi:hypothetical protein
MMELFAQVWILCVLAFLAGSGVTWLVLVRTPHHRPGPRPPAGTGSRRPDRRAPEEPRPALAAPRRSVPGEPALANLDTHHGEVAARHPGSTAAGALDRLGVAGRPSVPRQSRPARGVPEQAGPVDGPPPRGDG